MRNLILSTLLLLAPGISFGQTTEQLLAGQSVWCTSSLFFEAHHKSSQAGRALIALGSCMWIPWNASAVLLESYPFGDERIAKVRFNLMIGTEAELWGLQSSLAKPPVRKPRGLVRTTESIWCFSEALIDEADESEFMDRKHYLWLIDNNGCRTLKGGMEVVVISRSIGFVQARIEIDRKPVVLWGYSNSLRN